MLFLPVAEDHLLPGLYAAFSKRNCLVNSNFLLKEMFLYPDGEATSVALANSNLLQK